MKDFAAIDFETANNERTSVCSVGVVIVRDGEIVDTFYSLIQPEPNYYNYWCSQVHVNELLRFHQNTGADVTLVYHMVSGEQQGSQCRH